MRSSRARTSAVTLASLLVVAMATPTAAVAVTLYSSGACGGIPDATDAGPGVLSCRVTVSDPGTVPTGSGIVTVRLAGLQHEFSGDLIATLTHFTNATETTAIGASQYLFSRLGKLSSDPTDFGSAAMFGDPVGGGDSYEFNSLYTADLWAVAASLGSGDAIPGFGQDLAAGNSRLGQYASTDPFNSTPNSFSGAFAGQALAGAWRLDISDNAMGPGSSADPSVPYFGGSLQSFDLVFGDPVTAVPEPSYGWLLAALCVGVALRRRRLLRAD